MYLLDKKTLAESGPEIWREFMDGNWVVNKNAIPFCAIGADHGLEQVKKWWKSAEDFIGITLNHNALTKFFHVAPELSIIANEAHEIAGLKSAQTTTHYELSYAMTKRQEKNVLKLVDTIKQFCDPFAKVVGLTQMFWWKSRIVSIFLLFLILLHVLI